MATVHDDYSELLMEEVVALEQQMDKLKLIVSADPPQGDDHWDNPVSHLTLVIDYLKNVQERHARRLNIKAELAKPVKSR